MAHDTETKRPADAGPVDCPVRPVAEARPLVEHLRTRNGRPDGFGLGPVCDEAADEIERLRAALEKANEQTEHFEREWYLRGDELERLRTVIERAGSALAPGGLYEGVRCELAAALKA